MYKGRTKKFRDTIHGYIDIPDVIVSKIIDTEQFQRLKYIEQTSMRSLYPAARHDRFIHSLGVYWLGKKAFTYFRQNSEEVFSENERKKLTKEWWNKQEVLFSLACLLHDCSHAPFSHTLENMYILRKIKIKKKSWGLEKGSNIAELDLRLLKECEGDKGFSSDFLNHEGSKLLQDGVGVPHEKMSAYSAITRYKESIKEIGSEFLGEDITDSDIVFVVRMIIGCRYKKCNYTNSVKNCIISMLNSSSIDVDGLDYIVRDAFMSGIDNYNIDYQRLLSSFVVIPIEVFENKTEERACIDGVWLKGTTMEVKNLRAESISGGLKIERLSKKDGGYVEGRNCKINVSEGGCVTKCDEEILIKNNIKSGIINLKESCKFYKSQFSGTISGRKIRSGAHRNAPNGVEYEYVLGYDKRALSIIDGAIEARNHEYLWVYTHPKVLYSSNYLQRELLRTSAKYLCCSANNAKFKDKKLEFDCKNCDYIRNTTNKDNSVEDDFLLYIMGYDTYFNGEKHNSLKKKTLNKMQNRGFIFQQTCDDDLNALFKRIYIENAERNDLRSDKIDKEFQEYFSRRHKKPLWKSFVEYNKFSKMCDDYLGKRDVICNFCESVISKAGAEGSEYAVPSVEQQGIFEKYGLKDVIVIKSSVKTKKLNTNETFIKFKDETVRLCDIFNRENRGSKTLREDLYYIYANVESFPVWNDLMKMMGELDGSDKE